MQRCLSILLIVSEEEFTQKFIQTELEFRLARIVFACDACDIEDDISKLWGVAMYARKGQWLENMTCSVGSLGRKTCLLSCKTGSGKSLIPQSAVNLKRKVSFVLIPLLDISSD